VQAPLLTVDREDLENAIQGRRVRQARHDGPVKKASLRAGAASLLTNPDVMIFFVMVTLMGFAKGVVDSFLFIFIDELGAMRAAGVIAAQSPARDSCVRCHAGPSCQKIRCRTVDSLLHLRVERIDTSVADEIIYTCNGIDAACTSAISQLRPVLQRGRAWQGGHPF